MKHASAAALDALEPLLSEVRRAVGLIERKRGIFYRRSRAFLHFHEDAAGMFADVKRSKTGGKGLAGVMRKGNYYFNPFIHSMKEG